MNCSSPGLPVHHQLLEFTQTHLAFSSVSVRWEWVPGYWASHTVSILSSFSSTSKAPITSFKVKRGTQNLSIRQCIKRALACKIIFKIFLSIKRLKLFFFFFFFKVNWRIITPTLLCWLLPYISMNQPQVYICPLPLKLPRYLQSHPIPSI